MSNRRPIHLLVIDDDADMLSLIREYFVDHDFKVSTGTSGRALFEMLDQEVVDLVLLDLKLPGEDGMQIAQKLRERAAIPIVLLTGRKDEADRVMGLELGADDYVTKPFSPRELLARVRAVLRRYQHQVTSPARDEELRAFRFSGWELNLGTRRLKAPDDSWVSLSNGEFSLLNALCRAPHRVLSRDQLLSMSRLHEGEVYDRTVDVQIRRLRMKLESDPANPALILTERGAGYRFNCDVALLY